MIVGAGLAGAASAYALAQRGVPVVLVEQYAAGHQHGSSHGSARIVRRAYSDALYVSLTGRAFDLWRDFEDASGTPVLRMLGGLDFGRQRDVDRVAELLADAGVAHEVLPAAEAESRWPGMVFDSDVVFHPQAGTVDAALAVEAFLREAARLGADLRFSTPATGVTTDGSVALADGSVLRGRCAVVCAGGWVGPLIDGALGGRSDGGLALPPLRVEQQQIFHFPRLDPTSPAWPSVIHLGEREVYHLAGGRDGGPGDDRKIGEHDAGRRVTAGEPGVVDPASRARVVEYVKRYLPGLDPSPRSEATCLYTTTPSEDFVLDRVADLVVCSPCSGHGAKFAPLIGELVADLVTGTDRTVPDRFRLAGHATAPPASVSL